MPILYHTSLADFLFISAALIIKKGAWLLSYKNILSAALPNYSQFEILTKYCEPVELQFY
jgi:hypothetical protein